MIQLILQQEYLAFILIASALIFSLTFHEFGHGLLIGIGYAKPVPADPRKFNTRWGVLLVAAAGPAMNLLLAIVVINVYAIGLKLDIALFQTAIANFFFTYLALINMLLMLFNLLPVGPLDGSYILPYALSRDVARRYQMLNARYGTYFLLGLIVLNFLGVPVFESLWKIGQFMLGIILFV
jgi:Zn-dependent protease